MREGSGREGKQTGRKPLPAMGSNPGMSAMVGGMSNKTDNPSQKKSGAKMSFAKGGAVNEGGFRNNGMVNRR
jgi:hypothetical protein